jgi:thioester reductase-like protein
VREQQHLLEKVCAVPGDITLPGLGLAPSTAQQLQSELQFILHTAADIRLEVGIQSALTANYQGTAAVLHLARGCKQLRALVHTSSCFVNMNQPHSSNIDSRIYPLSLGDRTVSCQDFVQVRTYPQHTHTWHAQGRATVCCLLCCVGPRVKLSQHLLSIQHT